MDDSPRATVRSPFPNHAWLWVWDWIQPFRSSIMADRSHATKTEFVDQQLAVVESGLYRTWAVERTG